MSTCWIHISNGTQSRNRRMPNGTYGGVRGRKMTVGGKQPTSFSSYSIALTAVQMRHLSAAQIAKIAGFPTKNLELSEKSIIFALHFNTM